MSAKTNITCYKAMVKNAKNRLNSNSYDASLKNSLNQETIGKFYDINSKTLTAEELQNYYRRIEALSAEDDPAFAIGRLIDTKVYEKLSGVAKERYVMTIAKMYRDMKGQVKSEK
ncbi:MAG: hypothetical protein FWD49_02945 [Firmicutes bacterium]|nr:hypothetical protein [Bacillota bacterium]